MNLETNSEIASVKKQMYLLLVALIALSSALTAYLYQQGVQANREVTTAHKLINEYNQSEPMLVNFVNQLAAYGKTHPDFQPVLMKYGIGPNGIPVPPPAAKK
ncbi:MAG TPA: hypothetical protein VF607_03200 [Verrucomicrobiae bacterium]